MDIVPQNSQFPLITRKHISCSVPGNLFALVAFIFDNWFWWCIFSLGVTWLENFHVFWQWRSWHVCSVYWEWSMDKITWIQNCWWMEALVFQWPSCWVHINFPLILSRPQDCNLLSKYPPEMFSHERPILTRNGVNCLCWLQVYPRIWQKSYLSDHKGLCINIL